MNISIKSIFQHYLRQLEIIVSKTPAEYFSLSISDDMLSLEDNAKVASDFSLRGYCPLLNQKVVSFFSEEPGKIEVQKQLVDTMAYLNKLPEVTQLSDDIVVKEKAGFAEVELSQPLFLHQYILPNFVFHISMVYSIAKSNGVSLGKRDFDGIHSYPEDFRFDQ